MDVGHTHTHTDTHTDTHLDTDSQDRDVLAVVDRFAAAEQQADTDTLAAVLTEDFHGVGPLGFVLTRAQWIDRYASGALVPEVFALREVRLRRYGPTAVVLAVAQQEGSYHGHRSTGEFRAGLVLVQDAAGWRVASCQLSGPLGPPPGRPGPAAQ